MGLKGYSIRNLLLDVASLTEAEYFSNHSRENFDIMLCVTEDVLFIKKGNYAFFLSLRIKEGEGIACAIER